MDERPLWERYPYNKPVRYRSRFTGPLFITALLLAGLVIWVSSRG